MSPTLADSLSAAPAVLAARSALAGSGAWLVGGAIRDALLGRPVVDVDLAVSGGERDAARALAREAGGHAFELSADFATWRVVAADGSWHLDVSRLRGASIEDDLRGRDFTANALAVSLDDLAAGPVDPLGGLADMRARRLRAASERSFADDPLRIMRAARLAANLGFELDEGTVELGRSTASRAAEPAGERLLAELRMLIAGPDPLRGLGLLDALGATAAVLPEVEALRGVQQNPNHHLDVHGHTLEVLARLLEAEGDLESYAGERAPELQALLAEPLGEELTRGGALRLGALVHDIGKPATRDVAGGYVTFIGHDRVGAEMVGEMFERLRASRALRSHLRALTLHHLRLGFLVAERPVTRRRIHQYLRATDPVAADVTLLTVADRLAARGEGALASEEMIGAHLEVAREMLAAALDWRREGPPRPPIRGDELAAEVGIEPGPQLGRLLAEIEEAMYAGEAGTREEVVALARRRVAELR